MSKQRKRKNRQVQLLVASALVATSVAPYAVSAQQVSDGEHTGNGTSDVHTYSSLPTVATGDTAAPEVYGLGNVVKTYRVTAQYGAAFQQTSPLFFNDAVLAITNDEKKYIQLSINPTWKMFLKGIDLKNDEVVKSQQYVTGNDGNPYLLLEVTSFDTIYASINAMQLKEGTIDFPQIATEFNEDDLPLLGENEEEQTSNANDATPSNEIGHRFSAVEVTPGMYGSVGGGFIDNYLKEYFTNAKIVTVDGQKYIEMTLSGKAYAITSFDGGEFISSVGEKMNQVRVVRIPAAKTSTHRIQASEYGVYDLTFTFDVTDAQLEQNEASEQSPETSEQYPLLPNVLPSTFIQNLNYTMVADPNGEMADFITNYLNPYMSNAKLVEVSGEKFVEIKLTGKAYAFDPFQYYDAHGQKYDIEIVSSIGEKMDQVRIARIPYQFDENGITKVFVNSSSGYGSYNLLFDFEKIKEDAAPTQPITHIEQDVDFAFTTTGDFDVAGAVDGYLKAFVTDTDLEFVDGKPYALIEFGGHSYGYSAMKEGSAQGPAATIVQESGSAETKDWVRTVRVALDENYQAAVYLESTRGNYTYSFDFGREQSAFELSTKNNTYFKSWVPRADVVKTKDGQAFAYVTLAGHSYGVATIQQNGQVVPIVSSKGSVDGADLVRVVKVALDAQNKATLQLDMGGDKGVYEFNFDFTEQVATFEDALTDAYQEVELAITAGTPAQFIIPGVIAKAQAKKDASGITFSIETTKAESARGYYKTFIVKQNGQVLQQVSAQANETAQFTVTNINDLTVEVVYAKPSTADTASVTETTYTGAITSVKVKAQAQPTPPVTTPKEGTSNNSGGTSTGGSSAGGNSNVGTTPGGTTGGSTSGGSADYNNAGQLTVEKSVSHSFTAQEVQSGIYGSVPGSFIENYLAPYFTNAQLVTVNGTKYIQMTIVGKGYGVKSFGGGQFVSSTGEGLNQVRVLRIPAAKESTHRVDAGDYGIYNLTFTFDVSDADLVNSSSSTGSSNTAGNPSNDAATNGTTTEQTKPAETAPQLVDIPSTGDAQAKLAVTAGNEALKQIISAFQMTFNSGKFNVKISLANTKDVKHFIVKQHGKEIARWKNPAAVARVASLFGAKLTAATTELAFEVASLEGITVEAETTTGNVIAAIEASSKVAVDKPTVADDELQYTMQADPSDSMSDFITNYLAPYFTKVKEVEIDGQQFIEMTLVGKAYGFAAIQYEDANGQLQDVTTVSKTGEKLEQVRVIRLPLVQDKDGVTKIRVDSGDLGYGAYTLHFTFDTKIKASEQGDITEPAETTPNPTPAPEATPTPEAKPTISNPFTDIEKSSFKDDIVALYAAGITTGTTDTTFSPGKSITRAQFAVMLARALELQPAKATQFTDVKGKWYEDEVQALVEVGIVTSAKTFNPAKSITRQQAAAMIHRMLAFKGYTSTATAADLSFKDSAKVQGYAKVAIAELQKQSIMTGSNGYINASDALTRGQMAKILKRSLQLVDYQF